MPARTILVTGAAGFVGRHLIPALAAAFAETRIIGTGLHGAPDLMPLDVTQPDAVRGLVAAQKPDICFHLAGIAAPGQARADPGRAWTVNLQGSLNLADAILAAAPRCRLVFISSAEAYGASFRAGEPLDETAPLAPINLYAATKAAADLALGARVGEGLRLLRLRPFNHTGPGQDEISSFQLLPVRSPVSKPGLRRRNWRSVRSRQSAISSTSVTSATLMLAVPPETKTSPTMRSSTSPPAMLPA